MTQINVSSRKDYNRVDLQFDQPVRHNAVNSVADSGYFYIDVYGITTSYKRRVLSGTDQLLRQSEAVSYPELSVLRLAFFTIDRDVEFRVNMTANPPRLVVEAMRPPGYGKIAAPTATPTRLPGQTNSGDVAGVVPSPAAGLPASMMRGVPGARLEQASVGAGAKKIVIIDPGHGGATDGARSSVLVEGRQIAEKDLTLQFASQLQRAINNTPNMVAILTRPDDRSLGLEERVRFAEDHTGDLFISIHMNDGSGNPNAAGIEFYSLSDRGTTDAAVREVERRENDTGGAPATGYTPLLKRNLTDLERNKLEDWGKEGRVLCEELERSFLGVPYFRQHNRGVKSAAFVVLQNFKMPAVLVEVGFVTNTEELARLMNPQFQQRVAERLCYGIGRYFNMLDPAFKAPAPVSDTRGALGF